MKSFYLFFIIYIVNGLEDDLKFEISWPGDKKDAFENIHSSNILNMKTIYNENYKCVIPDIKYPDESKKAATDVYVPVLTYIDPLYTKKICYYRIESYWIYELCHGQYIRQYHETKLSGNRVVTQEYFLGNYDVKNQAKEYYEENGIKKTHIHWKIVEGKQLPSFAVKYNQGTECTLLANEPRETTVFYICEESGNENIISFEEISTCKYEMIVTSKSFCSHPAFEIPKLTQEKIECFAEEHSMNKPFELMSLENEKEESKDNFNKITMTNQDGSIFVIRYKAVDDEQTDETVNAETVQTKTNSDNRVNSPISTNADKEVIDSFLAGTNCLSGGTGWWKYEICFGKHVIQYHEEDINSPRTVITLGKWNQQKHSDWIKEFPSKKLQKKMEKIQMSLYYTGGDVCDGTNKPRAVEVKLKCDKLRKGVALYLLEPSVCEYVLAIESPTLCQTIEDYDSLVNKEEEIVTNTP